MMWSEIVICALILSSLIYAQKKHYEYLTELRTHELEKLSADSTSKLLTEFTDYKKRVDTLTMKAGFKL